MGSFGDLTQPASCGQVLGLYASHKNKSPAPAFVVFSPAVFISKVDHAECLLKSSSEKLMRVCDCS